MVRWDGARPGWQWDQQFPEELHSSGWNKVVGEGGCKEWNKVSYEDYNKEVLKGDGQGNGGKSGGFNGYCCWCGG